MFLLALFVFAMQSTQDTVNNPASGADGSKSIRLRHSRQLLVPEPYS
jgi:hypothetical protein